MRKLTRIEDLRGKAVAVDSPRGGYTLLLRRMLAAKGLTTADYTMSLAGGSKEKDAAMRSGTALAAAEFDAFGAQPRPRVTPGGLRQVIDMVWEAEGYKTPPGAPEKYFDLGYLQKAGE